MQDLKSYLEETEFDDDAASKKDSDPFDNYRTNLVTVVAYLIGVPEDELTSGAVFDIDRKSVV